MRESSDTNVSAISEERERQSLEVAALTTEHEALVASSEEAASENEAIFARMEKHQADLQASVAEARGERDELAQVNAALEAKVQQLQERTTELAHAAQRSSDDETVNLVEASAAEDDPVDTEETPAKRPFSRGKSRYERNSAKLPRIGDEAGSVLKSMQDLRASLTEE
jgi:predicted nuclease with TOPRIM domain